MECADLAAMKTLLESFDPASPTEIGGNTPDVVNATDIYPSGKIYLRDDDRYLHWNGAFVAFNYGLEIESGILQLSTGQISFGGYGQGSPYQNYPLLISKSEQNVLQLGGNHATVATDQTIKAHDVVDGTGAAVIIEGGDGNAAKGAVLLEGGNRATPNNFDVVDIIYALYQHGLMAPPLNSFSSIFSSDASSITVQLGGTNTSLVTHDIYGRYSTDEVTWTDAGNLTSDTGEGADIFAVFSGLDSETGYYLQWRSGAAGGWPVYSEWSDSQSYSTTE